MCYRSWVRAQTCSVVNLISLRLWCIHCVRTILSPGSAIPYLFHYQCVSSYVCIWCWLLCRYACDSGRVLCEEAKAPMIAILFSSLVGMSKEWLTGVSQVVGSRPDKFSCELNFIKALVYTLCEDNMSPGCAISSLIFHYQCVFTCVCIWCWLLCRYACESERVLCEEAKAPMIAILFSSLVGMSIEWLTGVSQVVGSRPDKFSCELKFIKALVYTLCEDNLVPWLRYYQCVFSCVCIWCSLLCRYAC